jgi:hypothetical protein
MGMVVKSVPTGDEVLPSGAVVHWDDRDGRRIAVTCGECAERSYTSSVELGHPARKNWRCHACGTGKRRGNEQHKSGTVIHWSVRPPGDPWSVYITCYKCGADSFIRVKTTRDERWNGQCSECYRKFGSPHPRKRYEDQRLGSGSVILWSKRDECRRDGQLLEVWVRCGICEAEKLFHRSSVKAADFEGYCSKHTRAELVQMLRARTQNNSQPPIKFDPEGVRLLEVVNAVIDIWKAVKSPSISDDEALDLIKQPKVAQRLRLGDEAAPEGAKALGQRLRRLRVNALFTSSGKWWHPFVKFVVDNFKSEVVAESIVLELLQRRESSVLAA